MIGNFIDVIRFSFKSANSKINSYTKIIETNFGKVRVIDTKDNKQTIILTPDGPNVIEHYENLISLLSKKFRVVCFEFPGIGFSYPNFKYNYSISSGSKLLINLMDELKIERATLTFSCSNGFYAIKAAQIFPERINRLILSQTPSIKSMLNWKDKNIPKVLNYPILGNLVNSISEKKFANNWYKRALPKGKDFSEYQSKAVNAINNGGCFCLSGLVQGLNKKENILLETVSIPSTLIWGKKDYSHRGTNYKSITEHLPTCEIIEFKNCGHFPELENTENYVKLINERV